ncbi:MAG: alpha/beta hydrolase [Planctomycetales bacterium]
MTSSRAPSDLSSIVRGPVVMAPGWGFDARVLESLPIPEDQRILCSAAPDRFVESLSDLLDAQGVARTSLFGWSLGARLALDFAAARPDRVDRVWLCSLKPVFSSEEIQASRDALARDRRAALKDFYRRAFLGGRPRDRKWFAETLENDYLDRFRPEELSAGLDYLEQRRVAREELDAVAATLFHGERDVVSKASEMQAFVAPCDSARLTIVQGAGHGPFLGADFDKSWRASLASVPRDD